MPAAACPVCRSKDLSPHCAATTKAGGRHPTCRWIRCRLCGAVLDPQNARGVDHKLRPFRLGAPG